MIINSVRMINFKSHADTEVRFGAGINVILGDNGAGKTSILEALSFALFKEYSGNLENLVRRGSPDMAVEVEFTSHGRRYRVLRRRTKNTTESRLLLLDGTEKELRSGDVGVDEEMESILGIDKYLFSNAIYVRQGEIERLLTDAAHKKKQLIGRLLGIEVLEKVWEQMKPLTDRYKERKSVLEGEIMREDEIVKQKKELASQLSGVKERSVKTRNAVSDITAELRNAEAEEKKLTEKERKYLGFSVKRDEIKSMLDREQQRLSATKKQLDDIGAFKIRIADMMKEITEGWNTGLEKKLSGSKKRISEIDEKTGALRGRIDEMGELDGKLEKAGNKCPLCGSELSESHRVLMINERKEKTASMRAESEKLAKERSDVTAEVENLEAKKREHDDLEKKYIELRSSSGRYDELKKAVGDGHRIVDGLSSKLDKIEAEMKAFEAGKEAYDNAKKRVKDLRDEVSGLKVAQGNLDGKMQEISKSIERLDNDVLAIKGKKEDHAKLVEFIGILNEIRAVFDKSGLQLELRKRAVPVIENQIREFFREFNFDYSDISLDENYDITLYGPAGESTTEMMSGGERIAAALALRLGIARTLAGSSAEAVMLDEPTIFLDEQRRQDLIEVFKKMTVIPQMIVVTHDTAMEDAADQITVIKKVRGVSGTDSDSKL